MSLAVRKPNPLDEVELSRDAHESARDEEVEYDDGLLAIAGPIMLACYTLLFTIAVFTFGGSGSALFAVAISMMFAVVFFAIPMIFFKIRSAHDSRWCRDGEARTSASVDTWTGSLHRWEAVLQIVTIPLAILLGFSLLAIRWGTL